MTFIRQNLKIVVATILAGVLTLIPRLLWGQDVDVEIVRETVGAIRPLWMHVAMAIGGGLVVTIGLKKMLSPPTKKRDTGNF